MPFRAKFYISLVLISGTVGFAAEMHGFSPLNPTQFWCYFLFTALTSGLKVRLPMVTATLSVNFLFILVGIAQFSMPEAIFLAVCGTIIQCLWRPRVRPKLIQIAFSVCSICLAVMAAHSSYHGPLEKLFHNSNNPLRIGLACCAYFLVNTVLVAGVIALTERKAIYKTWFNTYFWILPYHLTAASLAWLILVLSSQEGWTGGLILFPLVYFIYRAYRMYLERIERDKKHVEEIAGLHLRTIEALALAIEAKDATTHQHLQRVRVYATEIGKEIGLDQLELDALQAAALLHDIGKLAVPEHIISKPGKLTPEEFEKMKVHPVVGAEILEQVKFPYPVVPIVRAHHEKWDGSGYPYGLSGEDIPIGARILSIVDCLDALASDRQYRRAMPLDKAMEIVCSEAGKSFDPQMVEILKRRYLELEHMATKSGTQSIKLSMDIKIERGLAPAVGFAEAAADTPALDESTNNPLSSIAAATQEAQMLYELTQDLGNSLSLQEALAFVAVRLKRLIPYETVAAYIRRDEKLIPEYVSGENLRLFTSLEIPIGQGLSGWVAENNKSILNGNPSVEAGYMNDPTKYSTLRSALAVPLNGIDGCLGVLALYRAERDAFSKENLRILMAISSKVALAVENALTHRLLETSITTDYLTNLPNARSLFLSLDTELSRAQRSGGNLAIVVCDLDGFKQVNDRFGHLIGNKVLRSVADGFRDSCQAVEYVGRMGGDEFVFLFPDCDMESLPEKINHLRNVTLEAGATTPEPCYLSLSIGISSFPQDGSDAEKLLAEADRRMYKSKNVRKKERSAEANGSTPGHSSEAPDLLSKTPVGISASEVELVNVSPLPPTESVPDQIATASS